MTHSRTRHAGIDRWITFALAWVLAVGAAARAGAEGYAYRPITGTEVLGAARVTPLALVAGDFDGDGVQDLVSGYALGTRGALVLRRGNVDALFPGGRPAPASFVGPSAQG